MRTYGLTDDGKRFYSKSYNCYSGNWANLGGDWGDWDKQPARWRTAEGAAQYKAKRSYMGQYRVEMIPLTTQEKAQALHAAAPDLLKAAKVISLCVHIREYLMNNDPKALLQLETAITKAEGN